MLRCWSKRCVVWAHGVVAVAAAAAATTALGSFSELVAEGFSENALTTLERKPLAHVDCNRACSNILAHLFAISFTPRLHAVSSPGAGGGAGGGWASCKVAAVVSQETPPRHPRVCHLHWLYLLARVLDTCRICASMIHERSASLHSCVRSAACLSTLVPLFPRCTPKRKTRTPTTRATYKISFFVFCPVKGNVISFVYESAHAVDATYRKQPVFFFLFFLLVFT
ncbi:unnamed protein product [Ectocarpus sp. 4 AP-2014]